MFGRLQDGVGGPEWREKEAGLWHVSWDNVLFDSSSLTDFLTLPTQPSTQ